MNAIIRPITADDVAHIAAIHAASWKSAYVGMLREKFLQSDLVANRVDLWSRRLASKPQEHFGFIAQAGAHLIGFTFAFGDEDPNWGTQLDNLHVLPEHKGNGVGKALLSSVATACRERCKSDALFLWVYEANVAARSFYASLGAQCGERLVIPAPGGGEVAELRYSWPTVGQLLQRLP